MRRHKVIKRIIVPDLKYNSQIVTKLINIILKDGKLTIARNIVYSVFEKIREQKKCDPLNLFTKALENVIPKVEVKSRRIGGTTYQIPVEVSEEKQKSIALRWIVMGARNRKGMTIKNSLMLELIDAYEDIGYAVKKKNDTHKMAQANRAFAHFNW